MASEQRQFWSKVAPKYDQVVDLQIGPETRSLLRERVSQEGPLGKLVEFGCGTGFYTQVLATKAESVVATDLAPGMLEVARGRVESNNVSFQVEDCQEPSFSDEAFDSVFVSLVLHFTDPHMTLREMHRILKRKGTLIIANLDPLELKGLDRLRCLIRVFYQGAIGYRLKPPKGFGRGVMTQKQVCELLEKCDFKVLSVETFRDASRSSNIPVEYIRALKT